MRFIRFKDGEVKSAIVSENNEVYSLGNTNYVEFYYAYKSSGLTFSEYIREHNLLKIATPLEALELLMPIQSDEVWAAGVTYEDSKRARVFESTGGKLDQLTYYDKVYNAGRPEIFLKSTSRRTVGPNEEVYIRRDSNWQIPEPELGLVIGENNELIGFTLGNDMSCRDIEGENPLYLPQAKVWKKSCSIGPSIVLPESVNDPYNIDLKCTIWRDNTKIFEGTANTSQLKRSYDELIDFLVYDNDILAGTVLLTGTCIVPPNEFTLHEYDVIEISSNLIGTLRNTVRKNSPKLVKVD